MNHMNHIDLLTNRPTTIYHRTGYGGKSGTDERRGQIVGVETKMRRLNPFPPKEEVERRQHCTENHPPPQRSEGRPQGDYDTDDRDHSQRRQRQVVAGEEVRTHIEQEFPPTKSASQHQTEETEEKARANSDAR